MEVALVGTLPDADATDHRGPERTTIGLGEALSSVGVDVTVVADEGDPAKIGVPAYVLCDEQSPGIGRMMRFNHEIHSRSLLDSADIVHTWRPLYEADVMSWHGIGMEDEVEAAFPGTFDWKWRLGAKIHRWAKTLTAHRADYSVVTAPGNCGFAEKYRVPVDDVIPVGVENRFRQADSYDDSVDVLTVSRIERRKQPHFVDQHTPDSYETAVVGGASDQSYAGSLSERWVGRVNDTELLSYYRSAGVFVLPSYFEPFGLTAAEAMAAETPLVVADTTAISEWVREYDLGAVYEFDNPASYRQAIQTVFEDRDRYIENATAFVENRLTWRTIAEEYVDLYQQIDADVT
ncbi:Glycosyltransferase involved in cell wall bisynthesis [Halorientalis persicus]|uniref:Glycosyltransferase involved in cell wall bisynthesis n=1 Tax=Halorientalis persicus TaxID=1367881 RepID=A0A1H8R151_9EURY|nr:glycosyltransferase family 4 protein [Halorientalis persicus]SEO60329.1 Glycosyltransferase involved in cell wall bisynthesis [Halorientalis persicus]